MKVLLISENRSRDNLAPFPLGISYVAAATKGAGHEVLGLDLMFSDDPRFDITEAIRRFDPDCIGLSIRNIDNQDVGSPVFYLSDVVEIAEVIKSSTEAPVIAGGAGFTIFPLECLEYLGLELGIVGEAEESFPALLSRLESGGDLSEVPGLAMMRGGERICNDQILHPDITRAPPPDRETFKVENYNWVPGEGSPMIANIQSRRGCHMKCIYCSNPMIEGRLVRSRDVELVLRELQSLENDHGIGTVTFVDSLFNHPLEYAKELCRRMIKNRLSIRWTCIYNPFNHDPELLNLLKAAGCFLVSIGNESGSQDILRALKKGFSKKDIEDTVKEAKRADLTVNCFLLLGSPGETRKTIEESTGFIAGLAPDMVSVTPGIRIYPGCELHRIAIEEGVVEPDQNLLAPTFYVSQKTRPWLYDYAKKLCAENEGWRM